MILQALEFIVGLVSAPQDFYSWNLLEIHRQSNFSYSTGGHHQEP